MWNQDARSTGTGRPRARRNRISGSFTRAWAWTRKHVFRNRRMANIEFTTRVPSTLSDESFSSWDDPIVVRQSTTSEGRRPQLPERREVTPRKRFQDRKLDHDHIVRVTKALHDEMKKDTQEKRIHAPEPHLTTSEAPKTNAVLKDS
ncbi:hypothetical protein GE061_015400 [Apolygus lucorum]|uniref:Uncharacterized protein n=1 Tax=Apolygus lucorum TaxID=248454 RepID=A0A8S9XKV2_APOLU|nr:hypothetical protein GE061_015400 [Apolygus lucorum]